MKAIRILLEAAHDLEIGSDFYESQRAGLGRYFMESVLSDIDALSTTAGVHQREHGRHRMLAKRFPFAVYYELNEDVVEIYAVLDCRQDPQKIADRLA